MPKIEVEVDFEEALKEQCKAFGSDANADYYHYKDITQWSFELLYHLSYEKMVEALKHIIDKCGDSVEGPLKEWLAGKELRAAEDKIEILEERIAELESKLNKIAVDTSE
jgi:hypothetical protein